MRENSPLAMQLTFELVRRVQRLRHSLMAETGVMADEWKRMVRISRRLPSTAEEDSLVQMYEAIEERCLTEALTLETRVLHRLMLHPDLLEGLRASLTRESEKYYYPPQWAHPSINSVAASLVDGFFKPLAAEHEFSVRERSGFPLSAHPKIRRLHPDYDAHTGYDHDPGFMQQEVVRWADDFCLGDRMRLEELLTDSPTIRQRALSAAREIGLR